MEHLALEYLFEAFSKLSKFQEESSYAWVYSDIANVYYALGQIDQAEPYYWNGLKIMQKMGNEYGQSVMYNNIALCRQAIGKPEEALPYLEKALALRQRGDDKYVVYHSYSLIADTYLNMNDIDRAMQYYQKIYDETAKPAIQRELFLQLRATTGIKLFQIYQKTGKYDIAPAYLDTAIATLRDIQDQYSLCKALQIKGDYQIEQDKPAKALISYKEVFRISKDNNFYEYARNAAYVITKLSKKMNLFDEAEFYFEQYRAYYDSLYATRSGEGLIRLNTIVQNHLKDTEQRAKDARNKMQIRYLAVVMSLLAIIAFFAIRAIWQDKKLIKKLHQLADASSEGIVIHDSGKIIDTNSRFPQMVKMTPEAVIGKNLVEFSEAKEGDSLQKAYASNEVQHFESTMYDSEGIPFAVEASTRPFTHQNKYVRIAAIRDVSDTKKYLESIISQQRELQELNATKDRLFSIIAHDLKNPFHGIIGISKIMSENIKGFSPEDLKEMIEMIHESSKTAYTLLENLLAWARIQTGHITYQPTEQNVLPILNSVISLSRSTLSAKNIDVKLECPQNAKLMADELMLRTILGNLLSNAIKFTSKGGNITISVIPQDTLLISIRDSGIGMNEEQRSALFKMDSIHSEAGTDNEPGTGLGLILCKDMMDMHKGRITVSSEVGKGSCFTLEFPLE